MWEGVLILLFVIFRLPFCYENLCSVSVAALGDKIVRDIRPGAAFEPTYIYRLLTVIKSSLSEKVWDSSNVAAGVLPFTPFYALTIAYSGLSRFVSSVMGGCVL